MCSHKVIRETMSLHRHFKEKMPWNSIERKDNDSSLVMYKNGFQCLSKNIFISGYYSYTGILFGFWQKWINTQISTRARRKSKFLYDSWRHSAWKPVSQGWQKIPHSTILCAMCRGWKTAALWFGDAIWTHNQHIWTTTLKPHHTDDKTHCYCLNPWFIQRSQGRKSWSYMDNSTFWMQIFLHL